ncbi:CoA-binding protein [Halalkalibacter hemicellulosilyticus]|uniref:Succinyl-CoA synthetase n=1 Tax=Halalkalibacter hemicellulosilyticusJCM 9152 TaxID=1236971 RepID=W4QEQ9_9BACI|nr:CoA-binding protein [Halalkalibacter hemicellulosilyticus]GAE30541.1 succinyl-CoA synthetase [Halalkalibacter hemicellulosilyticusJCM 9152]
MKNPTDIQIKGLLEESKRIAVVGLSNNPARTSYQVAKFMQNAGFELIPVNPTIEEALGVKAVASLKDIRGTIDIVNVFRREEYLPEIAKEVIHIKAKSFWAQLGIENEEAYSLLKEQEILTIMNRCIKVEYARLQH